MTLDIMGLLPHPARFTLLTAFIAFGLSQVGIALYIYLRDRSEARLGEELGRLPP